MTEPAIEQPENAGRQHDAVTGRFVLKLTPEVHERIVKTITAGVPIEFAAAEAGVVRVTFYNWMKAGRTAMANANGDLERVLEDNLFARFAYDVEQAQARFVTTNMVLIGAIGRGEREGVFPALAWMLERRFPAHFGRKMRHEITGEGGGPIRHAIALDPESLERLSPERLRQLREIVAEMQGEVIEGEATVEIEP